MPDPLPESALVRQSERTASRIVDGKAVVVGVDNRKLHVMNPVGSRIWELADGRSLGEIVHVVQTEFEVERDVALSDARQFIGELLELDAVVVTMPEAEAG